MRWQDLHTHTHHSDGKSDIDLMVQAAGLYGLDTIAITDHCSGRNFPAETIIAECAAARQWANCHVMAGAEVVITDIEGNLAVPADLVPTLDIIICEMNQSTKGCFDNPDPGVKASKTIRALVNTCLRNPFISSLAHPLNVAGPQNISLSLFTTPLLDELANALISTNTAFELMSDQWWWFRSQDMNAFTTEYARIVRYLASKGVRFTLGSDAHSHQGVANFFWARNLMALAGISNDSIVYINPQH